MEFENSEASDEEMDRDETNEEEQEAEEQLVVHCASEEPPPEAHPPEPVNTLKNLPEAISRAAKRHRGLILESVSEIDKVLEAINSAKQQLKASDCTTLEALEAVKEAAGRAEEGTQNVVKEQLNSLSETCSEVAEAFSTPSLYAEYDDRGEKWEDRLDPLLNVISEHLHATGKSAAAEVLEEETGVSADPTLKKKFEDLYVLIRAVKRNDIAPALRWVEVARATWEDRPVPPSLLSGMEDVVGMVRAARADLRTQGALQLSKSWEELEFRLHYLNVVSMLHAGLTLDALKYLRERLVKVASKRMDEIKPLIGSFIYSKASGDAMDTDSFCPYPWMDPADTTLKRKAITLIKRCWCTLLQIPRYSNLAVCLSAGAEVLPTLLRYLMLPEGFRKNKELHLPALSKDLQFRSVISCPVTQQVMSGSNPAILLPCLHVISHAAVASLSRQGKLKCPYCLMECREISCRPLQL